MFFEAKDTNSVPEVPLDKVREQIGTSENNISGLEESSLAKEKVPESYKAYESLFAMTSQESLLRNVDLHIRGLFFEEI